jgi:hypothetical protein
MFIYQLDLDETVGPLVGSLFHFEVVSENPALNIHPRWLSYSFKISRRMIL